MIYIDFDLGRKESGVDVASTISGLGFENIFLATGFTHLKAENLPHIKGVVGKTPPWNS